MRVSCCPGSVTLALTDVRRHSTAPASSHTIHFPPLPKQRSSPFVRGLLTIPSLPAGISKLSGQAKAATYPQPEGVLGECMANFGRKLGDEEPFGKLMLCPLL